MLLNVVDLKSYHPHTVRVNIRGRKGNILSSIIFNKVNIGLNYINNYINDYINDYINNYINDYKHGKRL
jgi:hypothetical protein